MKYEDQLRIFQRRLAETRIWCALHQQSAHPAQELRTNRLRPSQQATGLLAFSTYDEFWAKTPDQRQQLVERLAFTRVKLLQVSNISISLPDMSTGRLLAFNPDATLSDGAAHLATNGFFDDDNFPAWDTWISYITDDPASYKTWRGCNSYLLSWVPDSLVGIVADGILVNPEESFCWATGLRSPFLSQLKQANLLC